MAKTKIILHIIALILVIIGVVGVHAIFWSSRLATVEEIIIMVMTAEVIMFGYISLPVFFVFDASILCIIIGFFIEFAQSFSPIKIVE